MPEDHHRTVPKFPLALEGPAFGEHPQW
jgi:hypothetical protein